MAKGKITTFLWMDDRAEEAGQFYASLFEDGSVCGIDRLGPGLVLIHLDLAGQRFTMMSGNTQHKLNEATSISVDCPDQAEVDRLWSALLPGGEELACGWLRDRFGLAWQIIPEALPRLLTAGSPAQSQAVMSAMMGMIKIDVAGIEAAFAAAV